MNNYIKVFEVRNNKYLTKMFKENPKLKKAFNEVSRLTEKDLLAVNGELEEAIDSVNYLIENEINNVNLWEKSLRNLKLTILKTNGFNVDKVEVETNRLINEIDEFTMNSTKINKVKDRPFALASLNSFVAVGSLLSFMVTLFLFFGQSGKASQFNGLFVPISLLLLIQLSTVSVTLMASPVNRESGIRRLPEVLQIVNVTRFTLFLDIIVGIVTRSIIVLIPLLLFALILEVGRRKTLKEETIYKVYDVCSSSIFDEYTILKFTSYDWPSDILDTLWGFTNEFSHNELSQKNKDEINYALSRAINTAKSIS